MGRSFYICGNRLWNEIWFVGSDVEKETITIFEEKEDEKYLSKKRIAGVFTVFSNCFTRL